MKKLAATLFATLFVTLFLSVTAFAQPTLTIVTETPGLPSELFYGSLKVKPLRLRPVTNTPITIADYDFFIQQQYIDMLKRFPEAGADGIYGTSDDPMQFYLNLINGYLNSAPCTPSNQTCINSIRGIVGANFFRSPEFQRKGNYVMYLYMVSIGQRPVTPAELPIKNDPALNDRPLYPEFMADLASISTPNDDPALTNLKKDQLAQAWVARPQIQALYPAGLTNAQFAQALATTAGVTLSSATQTAVANATTRAQILRIIAESPEVDTKYFQQSYVTMEYFGYLRRKPEDCHDQANWGPNGAADCGFIFHNARFNNPNIDPAHIQNIMLQGFIESPEYINRF